MDGIFTVFDRDFEIVGKVGAPSSYKVDRVHNEAGTGSLAVPVGLTINQHLLADGARYRFEHKGMRKSTGWIGDVTGPFGNVQGASNMYALLDDSCILDETLAWVAPGNPIKANALGDPAQTVLIPGTTNTPGTVENLRGYFAWATGSVEFAVKDMLQQNFDRLGSRVTILPNQDRGGSAPTVMPDVRFKTLRQGIQPLLDAGQLGIDVWHEPGEETLFVDVYETTDWGQPLTEASGVIKGGGTVTRRAARATRAVAGGPGEEAARAFDEHVDAELEAKIGRVIEVFRNATGASLKWPNDLADTFRVAIYYLQRATEPDRAEFISYMRQACFDAIAEGRPTSSVSVELAQTENFYVGGENGIERGTRVELRPSVGDPITDVVTIERYSLTKGYGETAVPVLGNPHQETEDGRIWAAVNMALGALLSLATSR